MCLRLETVKSFAGHQVWALIEDIGGTKKRTAAKVPTACVCIRARDTYKLEVTVQRGRSLDLHYQDCDAEISQASVLIRG